MLRIDLPQSGRTCQGPNRRDFLRVGALGLGGLTLADMLVAQASAASAPGAPSFVRGEKSIIFLYLAGGPSQYETWDPKPDGIDSFTSIAGHIPTKLPGVRFASYFPRLAARADRLSILHGLVAKTHNHAKAVKNMLTGGLEDVNGSEGAPVTNPSLGALYAQARGTTDLKTGMPSYAFIPPKFTAVSGLKVAGVNPGVESCVLGSGGGSLGAAFAPFNPEASDGWTERVKPQVPDARLDARRDLLKEMDQLNRRLDRELAFADVDRFNEQALSVLRGGAMRTALDLSKEDPHVLADYSTEHCPIYGWSKDGKWEMNGPSTGFPLGRQMLMARRLCEAGCRFVTVVHSNWDMHGGEAIWGMKEGMEIFAPPLDHAVAAFLDDVQQRGLSDNILLVVGGEFGRTGKINAKGGRDHNPNTCPMLFAGGGLRHGQVIGGTSSRGEKAEGDVYTVDDLCATLMNYLFDVGKLRLDAGASPHLKTLAIDRGRVIAPLS